jgi:hypothetical protein
MKLLARPLPKINPIFGMMEEQGFCPIDTVNTKFSPT